MENDVGFSAGGKSGLGVPSFRSKLFWRQRTNGKRNSYQKQRLKKKKKKKKKKKR